MKKNEEAQTDKAVRKHSKISAVLLLRQSIALFLMAREQALPLEKVGWSLKRTEAAERSAAAYEQARLDRRQATAIARLATRVLHQELVEARLFRTEVQAGARLLVSRGVNVAPELLKTAAWGSSGPKHIEWLRLARAEIEPIAGLLSAHVVNPLGRLEARLQALVGALGNQALAHRKLPRLSQEVVESRARLVAEIDDIRSAARIAFLRSPAVWLQFRKRGLEARARRAPPAAANDEPAGVPDRSIAS